MTDDERRAYEHAQRSIDEHFAQITAQAPDSGSPLVAVLVLAVLAAVIGACIVVIALAVQGQL